MVKCTEKLAVFGEVVRPVFKGQPAYLCPITGKFGTDSKGNWKTKEEAEKALASKMSCFTGKVVPVYVKPSTKPLRKIKHYVVKCTDPGYSNEYLRKDGSFCGSGSHTNTFTSVEEAEKALQTKWSVYGGKVVPVYVKPSTKPGPYVIRWRNRDGTLDPDYRAQHGWGYSKSEALRFATWQEAWDYITRTWTGGPWDPNTLPKPAIIRLKKKAVLARDRIFGEAYYVNRSTKVIKHATKEAAQAVCPDGCVTVGPLYGNVCEHPTT